MAEDDRSDLKALEELATSIGHGLKEVLPSGIGFCFVLFDVKQCDNDDGPGRVAYVSSGERKQVVQELKHIANRLEGS